MASSITPTQVRYNDPYQNQIFSFNTVDSKVYLSSESNKVLKAIGNNFVLKGLTVGNPTIDPTLKIISVVIQPGLAIQSNTVIEILEAVTVSMDVSGLTDTDHNGSHLAIFLNYEYLSSIESNQASIELYHVDSSGLSITPEFNAARCLTLLGAINFTKDAISGVLLSTTKNTSPTMSINGVVLYNRGFDPANVNIVALSGGNTGTSGTSGTSGIGSSGTSGYGTSGTSGRSPTSGTSGSSGTSGLVAGTSGTSGTSCLTAETSGTAGTSGSSGISGTGGTSGTSGDTPVETKDYLTRLNYLSA